MVGRGGSRSNTMNVNDKGKIIQHLRTGNVSQSSKSSEKSPAKTSPSEGQMITRSDIQAIFAKLEDLSAEIKESRRENDKSKDDLMTEIHQLRVEMNSKETLWSVEKDNLTKRIRELELRDDRREKKEKGKNFIIRGLDKAETAQDIEDFLLTQMDIVDKVAEVIPIIRKGENLFTIVSMATTEGKKTVMLNKAKKLMNTKVSISHDRTFKERDVQRKINAIAAEEEKKGAKVQVGYKRIQINGTQFIWDDEKGLIEVARGKRTNSSPGGSQRSFRH